MQHPHPSFRARPAEENQTVSLSNGGWTKPGVILLVGGILLGLVTLQRVSRFGDSNLALPDAPAGEGVPSPSRQAIPPRVPSDAATEVLSSDSTGEVDAALNASVVSNAEGGTEVVESNADSPELTLPAASSAGQNAAQELLDLSQRPVTPEQAREWRTTLEQLVASGDGAVQPIADFLGRHEDLALDQIDPSGLMGYDSLRLALFDALAGIGTPAAEGVLAQALSVTADPREIEWIAAHLEDLAPNLHREEALAAARDALALAANGELAGRDVGPLFAVLGHYGDTEAAVDLDSVSHLWGYYGLLATAKLPEAARLEPLVETANRSKGASEIRSEFALRLLAEEAWNSAAGYQSLTEIARTRELSPRAWEGIAEGLGGIQASIESSKLDQANNLPATSDLRRYHIASGNQNFLTAPKADMTIEEIRSRTALIEGLLTQQPGSAGEEALRAQLERLNAMDPYLALAGGL